MPSLKKHLQKHVPRCLAGLAVTKARFPIDERSDYFAAYALAQQETKIATAQVLGYLLGDYNPECQGELDFISPLRLRWPDGQETLAFDSAVHGYHGELGSAAKLHGAGPPTTFACPNCKRQEFEVTVQFDYGDAVVDLLDDEPKAPAQDFFTNILFAGKCCRCGSPTIILDMDL
ncbi:hypothetical protein ETAA8_12670 [Anatilimnocola aggregata]|uniref:Uncharacterized protein n=1 Tax=Anatilimnocola aggregata TaxID=2528021 RepID=A0A517Y7S1_9BACT|nr:hypothetical protein [Anatilimnocola aggregata]QDU26192.1 hypothetical protein ETAA8_12670 [Anatilimnocola aggregata]